MRSERGTVSRSKPETVEATFRDRLGGLVKSVEWVPEYHVGPKELRIRLWSGILADEGRFDVTWWTRHGYKYHYVEGEPNGEKGPDAEEGRDSEKDRDTGRPDADGTNAGLQFRFGWERRAGVPDKHFHPPDDLDAHRELCIRHEDVTRVTLAVIKCWHAAATAGDPEKLNALADPP
jgi:hypothetical protein